MRKLTILFLCLMNMFYFCSKKQEEQASKQIQIKPQPVKEIIQQDTVKSVPEPIEIEDVKQSEPMIEKSEKEITTAQLWQKYKESREASKEALSNSQFQKAINHLKLAANYAEKLDRNDLVAWQYNNIGYYSILEFKGVTNYDYRIHKIRSNIKKEKKDIDQAETKKIFKDNIKILIDAEENLKKALKIDANYIEKNRTEKIKSNLKFIDWVKNYIKN